MTQEEVNKVLENHRHWLRRDCKGWENMHAVLDGENLDGLNLDNAILDWASLHRTSLKGASLKNASLFRASLNYDCLKGANLDGASLSVVSFEDAIKLPFVPMSCPDTGSFIGWKKAGGKIIKLEIPADAKRCSAISKKCRCDKAKVLEIQNLDGSISDVTEISSDYDYKFIYEVGKTVSVADFYEDRWEECSQGIHFFINRQSAVEY